MLRLWWSRVAVTLEASLISSLVFSSLSEFPLLQESAAPNSTSIYFSYITSITGAGFRSGGARPVVDLALEQMNNNTDILPNYTPSYRTIRDSKVNKIQMWHSVRSSAVIIFSFSAMWLLLWMPSTKILLMSKQKIRTNQIPPFWPSSAVGAPLPLYL